MVAMDELVENYGLWGLFVSAFLSSTLLPGGSEAMLAALALHEHHDKVAILLAASAGNTLGGASSWLIGFLLAKKWPATKLKKKEHQRAVIWLHQYGSPILLVSWLPVVGDPLCVAAGWLRMNFWLSLLMIAAGKTIRYAIILLII
jgi:membrane protein YqaA with SNARE-associated domain